MNGISAAAQTSWVGSQRPATPLCGGIQSTIERLFPAPSVPRPQLIFGIGWESGLHVDAIEDLAESWNLPHGGGDHIESEHSR